MRRACRPVNYYRSLLSFEVSVRFPICKLRHNFNKVKHFSIPGPPWGIHPADRIGHASKRAKFDFFFDFATFKVRKDAGFPANSGRLFHSFALN